MRLRCLNLIAALRARGYPVELFTSHRARSYGLVVYSKVYDNGACRRAAELKRRGVRIAFDLCDNHFYDAWSDDHSHERTQQLIRMMDLADILVASTEPLKQVMLAHLTQPRAITVIGDAVESDIEAARPAPWQRWWHRRRFEHIRERVRNWKEQGRTPLVWFGSHGGMHAAHGMADLQTIQSVVERVNQQHPLSLTVISNSPRKYSQFVKSWSLPTVYLEWSPHSFLEALALHAITVIPVARNPFTICKSNNRLALALRSGVAVVADSIPSYEEFRGAVYLDAWEEGLTTYASNAALRMEHVHSGRQLVEARWTLARITDEWEVLLTAQV